LLLFHCVITSYMATGNCYIGEISKVVGPRC